MSVKSGEELKNPLIDSITSQFHSKSSTSLRLKPNDPQIIDIKEALNHTLLYLKAAKPKYIKLNHAIISSIYYKTKELIISLGIDGCIISYSLSTIKTSKIKERVQKIFKCFDEELFLAIFKDKVFVCESGSLQAIKVIRVEGVVGCCSYLMREEFVYSEERLFVMNLKDFEINRIKLDVVGVVCMDNRKDKCWCVADKNGIAVYDEQLDKSAEMHSENITSCKFSEKSSKILIRLSTEILICELTLNILHKLDFHSSITDFLCDETQNFLTVATSQGELITCDLRLPLRKIPQKLHNLPIFTIFLYHNKIISLSQDMRMSFSILPKLKNLFISPFPTLSFTPSPRSSQYYFLTPNFELKSSDYKESLTILLQKLPKISSLLLYHKEKLYFSSETELFQYNLTNLSLKSVEKPTPLLYTALNFCSNLLICAGSSNFVYIYNTESLVFDAEFPVHDDNITCMASYQKALVTGSLDKTVRVWDMRSKSNLHILSGHSAKITALLISIGKVFSASADRSLKIWYLKTGDLVHTISVSGIVKHIASCDSEFILTCNHFGILTYWTVKTYVKVLTTHLYGPIEHFDVNHFYIIYSNKSHLFVMQNPLLTEKMMIAGPKEHDKSVAQKYFYKLLSGKSPKFDGISDKWVVFPYILTPLHIYAYFNLPEHISASMNNSSALIQSRLEHSPLSIAVSRDLEACVQVIVKFIKPQLDLNPFLLNFITDRSLIEMNFTGHDVLAVFYKALFTEVRSDRLPRFVKYEVKLPIYAKSLGIMPKSQEFFTDDKIMNSGQAVVYFRSLLKVSLVMGSSSSIRLLQSVAECKNMEIFRTQFIKAYIEDKWDNVKMFMWVQFLLYFSYLFYFCLYLMQTSSNKIFLNIPLVISCVLTTYEIYKGCVSGKEYLTNAWNYIDAARAILFLIYYGQDNNSNIDDSDAINYTLLMLSIASFLRGFAYFRLFDYTRHFTQLLYQVILDSYAFSIILLYNTISFGFILLICFKFEDSFWYYLGISFQTDLGGSDPGEYNLTQWIIYAVGIALNNWVMLSVLISLYDETYGKFIEVAEIENIRVLAALSLEAERNIFWRRKLNQTSFLHMCNGGAWKDEKDLVVEKIKGVKKLVRKGINRIENMRIEILTAIDKSRRKEKKKRVRKEDIEKDAVIVFKMLVKGFRGSEIDKEAVESKVKSLLKTI